MDDPATRAYHALRIAFPWLPQGDSVVAVSVRISAGEPPYADLRKRFGGFPDGGLVDSRVVLRPPYYDDVVETPVYDALVAEMGEP